MRICVLGLGYVGCVSAACFAKAGHDVIGVDINKEKVDILNSGKSPIIESGLAQLINECVNEGRLKATLYAEQGIRNSDISLICVGTPSNSNGSLNLEYVYKVSEEIAWALKRKRDYHLVAVRSTVLPGTTESLLSMLERVSSKKMGIHFGTCVNPEFLREGSAIEDFYHPPYTIIGEYDKKSGALLSKLYKDIDAPLIRVDVKLAEMIKYVNNTFHALKVAFTNEIGTLCKIMGLDSHTVMEIFCRDHKLNISPLYLKPAFAFGGSCLPKDLQALNYLAKEKDAETPLLRSILRSNELHIQRALDFIMNKGKRHIGILGLSFKSGTDDLRESPMIELVERLIGKGYTLSIFDGTVNLAKLFGANKRFIEEKIPHIVSLMVNDMLEVFDRSEVIVIGNRSREFVKAKNFLRRGQILIDLVRIFNGNEDFQGHYEGICW